MSYIKFFYNQNLKGDFVVTVQANTEPDGSGKNKVFFFNCTITEDNDDLSAWNKCETIEGIAAAMCELRGMYFVKLTDIRKAQDNGGK